MAKRKVLDEKNEMLRKVSKNVTDFNQSLWSLLDDMRETMLAHDGAGLAAVQVGVLRRVFVVNVNEMYIECVNPEIVSTSGECEGVEGCLSVSRRYCKVLRPKTITINAFDREGVPFSITCNDFLARAMCHEYDHLNGIIFLDKAIDGTIKEK